MLVATASFVADMDGYRVDVLAGVTRVDESDPLALRYPDNFVPERSKRPDVEQATAAPGEKRGG